MRSRILRVPLCICAILLAGLLVAGRGAAQVIRSGPGACKAVAFTFDLCPVREGDGYDAPLIDSLIARRMPATFFLSGRWMATHEAEVRALLAVPFFELGTHGQVHAHLPRLDADRQRAEIEGPVTRFQTEYGYPAPLFRPPYGEYNDLTVELVRSLGLQFILWSVVSGDPDPRLSQARIRDSVRTSVRNGSVIVFHANGKGRHTRAVVEDLYQDLVVNQGLLPVTVTQLLKGCEPGPSHGTVERSP